MDAAMSQTRTDLAAQLMACLPRRVTVARDHCTSAERAAVERAAAAFADGEAPAMRLPDAAPFSLVHATSSLLATLRRDVSQPSAVDAIVTQEAWL